MKYSIFSTLSKSRKATLVAAFFLGLIFFGCQDQPSESYASDQAASHWIPMEQPKDKRIEKIDPAKTAQMAETIEELVKAELSEGLTFNLWGVDSLVADPISIDLDDQGRLYYTRTNRQKNSEFDIRRHQDWETESIRHKTIEDKRRFLHKELSSKNSSKNAWLADLNGDGSHDWRDMTVEKEHVYRLEDLNGDGVADLSQLVIEDFNDEVTDVAGAVLAHGNELYLGVAPDMWRIKDTNGDGIADEKTSISYGYGIHIGFSGHGMSGLEMGPDGRIYWGIGDIGFNGRGPDGTEWKYPNQGVIVRANPDGSDFEVFAMGLRNTHEFVFDEYGNIISVDNDGDHPGEHERLVYIVNGSDAGWRINWQFGKYRDPDNNAYKVWMDERMFKPRFEGQAAYITPAIANYVSGPAGMLYNPGTALSSAWKNTFFVSEFVGNPARSGIHAFKLKPKGASFELAQTEMIMKGITATGIDFGPDGALYVADWIDGWDAKDFGRVWKMDTREGKDWPERKRTEELLKANVSTYTERALGDLLKQPDMRVRQKAQFELVKRGLKGAEILLQAIKQTDHQLARIHGIWGISQLARVDSKHARVLLPLLKDQDPEIRAQAAKWLGDIRYKEAGSALLANLTDENSRARFFAAEALGRLAYEPAINQLIELLNENDDKDAYIRHAATLALARIGKPEPVIALASHASPAVRMGAVLVLRRLQHPAIAKFLSDKNEFIVTEAARAINDDYSIEEALPALGNVLKDTRFTNEPLVRRAINANLRVGTEEAMLNLIDYSLQQNNPVAMRKEAIDALSTWAKPSVLDRVDGRYRGVVERDPALVREKATGPLVRLLEHPDPTIRLSTVEALGKLGIEKGNNRLLELVKSDRDADVRVASLRVLAASNDQQMDEAIQQALSDPNKNVRVTGLDLLARLDIPKELMVSLLADVIEKRTIEEKQAALATLGSLPYENTRSVFDQLLDQYEKGHLPLEIQIELAEAVESTNNRQLSGRFEAIQANNQKGSPTESYAGALLGGDVQRGKRIFFQHAAAQCMRCHAYDDMGGNAGPRLNGIAGRLTRKQLLEALVDPSARLAPGYGVVILELKSGKTLSGILQRETQQELVVKVGNQPDTAILKDQIANRTDAGSSMPDMKYFLTKREIRDLVSFLSTLDKDHNQ